MSTNGSKLQYLYKKHLSHFLEWDQKSHSKDWLLYPKNIGPYLSLDETSFTNGELYTLLTNKEALGKKGSIVALIKGTKSMDIIQIINKIGIEKRDLVKEITVDMAGSMNKIARKCFKKAELVTDRFHVQKLALEAVQQIRIDYRWTALETENEEISKAKENQIKYSPEQLENGETRRQLLARSRYQLFKCQNKWTDSQIERGKLLFREYPDIEKAYKLSEYLKYIFENNTDKNIARVKLAKWFNEVEESKFKSFNTISNTIQNHYETILNYFQHRSTNASAESFNAKIKAFRAQFRGVRDIEFFLFRLCNIYA